MFNLYDERIIREAGLEKDGRGLVEEPSITFDLQTTHVWNLQDLKALIRNVEDGSSSQD